MQYTFTPLCETCLCSNIHLFHSLKFTASLNLQIRISINNGFISPIKLEYPGIGLFVYKHKYVCVSQAGVRHGQHSSEDATV